MLIYYTRFRRFLVTPHLCVSSLCILAVCDKNQWPLVMADSISKYNVDPADDNNLNLNQNEQHEQHSFVINEENLCSNFGLKEEIAAQSLILSALSGQLQEDAAATCGRRAGQTDVDAR